MGFVDDQGNLILKGWGQFSGEVTTPDPIVPMYGTAARATPLVGNGFLGADLIQIPAGEGFEPHTHIGDHLLIAVKGRGTITYKGTIYETLPGTIYMVEGAEPHAVGAIEDHALISVGAPHRAADAADRMALIEYAAVAAQMGKLWCMVCQKSVTVAGCPHAPHPKHRELPLLLAPTWDPWERRRLAGWFGLDINELGRAVQLVGFNDAPDAVQQLGGRLVIAYGKLTGGLLSSVMPERDYAVDLHSDQKPYLLVTVRWAAHDYVHRAILRLAHTIAAAGPLDGGWKRADAMQLGWAIDRAIATSK